MGCNKKWSLNNDNVISNYQYQVQGKGSWGHLLIKDVDGMWNLTSSPIQKSSQWTRANGVRLSLKFLLKDHSIWTMRSQRKRESSAYVSICWTFLIILLLLLKFVLGITIFKTILKSLGVRASPFNNSVWARVFRRDPSLPFQLQWLIIKYHLFDIYKKCPLYKQNM